MDKFCSLIFIIIGERAKCRIKPNSYNITISCSNMGKRGHYFTLLYSVLCMKKRLGKFGGMLFLVSGGLVPP